jgi:hypothetical protein
MNGDVLKIYDDCKCLRVEKEGLDCERMRGRGEVNGRRMRGGVRNYGGRGRTREKSCLIVLVNIYLATKIKY